MTQLDLDTRATIGTAALLVDPNDALAELVIGSLPG
ncbi:MAG: hypothetical protein JWM80_4926 [Cyanobacteria bacterium RYN_339]|nr:hypothetical protein [Cyanobacteria bacterium RYN_339]